MQTLHPSVPYCCKNAVKRHHLLEAADRQLKECLNKARRNPSYQKRFRFYLGLWYLSSLLEHDSNYSHQGACLEPSAKSVETASPQPGPTWTPDITALRLF